MIGLNFVCIGHISKLRTLIFTSHKSSWEEYRTSFQVWFAKDKIRHDINAMKKQQMVISSLI